MVVFKEKLPELNDLCRIAGAVGNYPASIEAVVSTAKNLGYGKNVIDFINLFSEQKPDKFESRIDFYVRAAELAMLICEEREQPKDGWLGPQD